MGGNWLGSEEGWLGRAEDQTEIGNGIVVQICLFVQITRMVNCWAV